MNIQKDIRSWRIKVTLRNDDCPFLFSPANIHACKYYRKVGCDLCNRDRCPILHEEGK